MGWRGQDRREETRTLILTLGTRSDALVRDGAELKDARSNYGRDDGGE